MSRGRGSNFNRGPSLPFVLPGEPAIGPVLHPPPLYPPTDKKLPPTKCDVDMEYLLLIDRVLQDHFNDTYESLETSVKEEESDKSLNFLWSHMPKELQPKVKTKVLSIKPNITNTDAELSRLEKLERKVGNTDDKDDVENIEDEFDEEMDEGTDYANDYFDNGETYEEHDDGDNGPVY